MEKSNPSVIVKYSTYLEILWNADLMLFCLQAHWFCSFDSKTYVNRYCLALVTDEHMLSVEKGEMDMPQYKDIRSTIEILSILRDGSEQTVQT